MKPDPSADTFHAPDILNDVLSHADDPGSLGAYLTEKLRVITRARCVLIIQCLCTETVTAHHVVGVSPEERREWAESATSSSLYEAVHHLPVALCLRGNASRISETYCCGMGLSCRWPHR